MPVHSSLGPNIQRILLILLWNYTSIYAVMHVYFTMHQNYRCVVFVEGQKESQRERERERQKKCTKIHIHIYIYIFIYLCIYIYMYGNKESKKAPWTVAACMRGIAKKIKEDQKRSKKHVWGRSFHPRYPAKVNALAQVATTTQLALQAIPAQKVSHSQKPGAWSMRQTAWYNSKQLLPNQSAKSMTSVNSISKLQQFWASWLRRSCLHSIEPLSWCSSLRRRTKETPSIWQWSLKRFRSISLHRLGARSSAAREPISLQDRDAVVQQNSIET